MSEAEVTFSCPTEMKPFCERVFAGEYDVTYQKTKPVILDIGANAGAFSLWALEKWPDAQVFAYEPAQANFAYLLANCGSHPQIKVTRAAVLATEKTKLYCGLTNQGEASFCTDLAQTTDVYELPPIIHPYDMPYADILKCDTEGCEFEIVLALSRADRLPECLLLEYHREEDRRAIDIELREYDLAGAHAYGVGRGVMKYIRRGGKK